MVMTKLARITIALPAELLQQVDRLASKDLTNRSVKIRQAIAEYVSKPQNIAVAKPNSIKHAAMYNLVKIDNPHIDPNDIDLIKFLYDTKFSQE